MTTMSSIPGLDLAPTSNTRLLQWVRQTAELTRPDRVQWCDGSEQEWERLTALLVEQGTFTRLDPHKRPNSFYAASDPSDVARVEDRTFICSARESDAGPTNNWTDPDRMRDTLQPLMTDARRKRTSPQCMRSLDGLLRQTAAPRRNPGSGSWRRSYSASSPALRRLTLARVP